MTHPREGPMGRVRLADLALEVRDEGRGPPALLLHGFPTTHRLWDGVIPLLRAAGPGARAKDAAPGAFRRIHPRDARALSGRGRRAAADPGSARARPERDRFAPRCHSCGGSTRAGAV